MTSGARETYRHGNVRDAAVEAAVRIVETEGRAAFSVRRIAQDIGVTHRALYRHFSDGESILNEAAALAFRRMIDHLNDAKTASTLVERYVAFALENPALYALMLDRSRTQLEATPALRAATQAMLALSLDQLAAPDQPKPDRQRRVLKIWMMLHGAIMLRASGILRARNATSLAAELKTMLLDDLES